MRGSADPTSVLFWLGVFLAAIGALLKYANGGDGGRSRTPRSERRRRMPPGAPIAPPFPVTRRPAPLNLAVAAAPPPPDYPAAWRRLPREIIFVDVETTGLGGADRIVSLGAVRLTTAPVDIATLHLIFNPEKRCHPKAIQAHGYDNKTLARQDPIGPYTAALAAYFSRADLVVAHNAAFDLRFLNGEFKRAAQPPIAAPSRCTMLAYRALGQRPATLDAVAARLGLPRAGRHSALEDAWIAMQAYLSLNGCPWRIDFAAVRDPGPANFRPPPPKRPRGRPRLGDAARADGAAAASGE